jgi:myosin V
VCLSVLTEDSAICQATASECYLQNERDDTVDDLVRSDHLHEPGILHTLRVRYGVDAIYTYSGQILIATNPHKPLRHLYGPRMMMQYRGVPLGELSPHVYAIAEAAYQSMVIEDRRQAILISGESGAGKTESAKMVMQYLAHRATATSGISSTVPARSRSAAPIEEQVLESNPLLEAFGNAKTARNDNSSRFGKFVEIDFDAAGRVTGAAISTYLLERSRVVSVHSPERSFHIFYQLCAGAAADPALAAQLHLAGGPRSFKYLAQSDTLELDEVDDAEAFHHTLDAMRVVGLQQDAVETILRVVAGVLHLGNLSFAATAGDDAELAPDAEQALNKGAELLGVAPDGLIAALTTRAIETRGERIIKRLGPDDAAESRDALAKALYSRLFDWIVAAVNRKIGALGGSGRTPRTIGILDIYGFESFADRNSFEQLCINLANEKLQQAFNAHVFKGEQAEYATEGIAWSYVEFVDNQDVLNLLEGASDGGTSSLGVFPLIDEACRLPRATHADLAHALRTKLQNHPRFGAPKRDQHAFVVDHYAGEVCYATDALLDKNRDFVVAEHAALMRASAVPLLQELFAAVASTPSAASDHTRRSAFMLASVGSRFRRQLSGLMATLSECEPHFIRCVKPNPASRPGALEPSYVLEQLRAGGVLEAVRIACAGYPTRRAFSPFARRYAVLLGRSRLEELGLPFSRLGFVEWDAVSEAQAAEIVKRVLYGTGIDGWQMGRSRVFLRAGQLAVLEGARGRVLAAAAVKVQAAWRGYLVRAELARKNDAASLIQSAWRSYVEAKRAEERRRNEAAVRLQAAWRRHTARSAFQGWRRARCAVVIQSFWRMVMVRRKFLRETEMGRRAALRLEEETRRAQAAVMIQSNWRRMLAQKHAQRLAVEKARFKEVQDKMQQALDENTRLEYELREAIARAERAEASAAASSAQTSSVMVQLESVRLAATESATEAAAAVEEARRRVASALQAEVDLITEQRIAAEARASSAERLLAEERQRVSRTEEALQGAEARVLELESERDRLHDKLKRLEASREHVRAEANKLVESAAVSASAAVKAAEERAAAEAIARESTLQEQLEVVRQEVESMRAEVGRRDAALRDAQEQSSRLASRVEALGARAERLESDARAAAARENALLLELEGAKRAAAVRSPLLDSRFRTPATTPLRRGITEELEAAASAIEAASPATAAESSPLSPRGMSAAHAAAVAVFTEAVIFPQLPMVTAWSGAQGSLHVPQAAWLLHRTLLHWARQWRSSEVAHAAGQLRSSIATVAADGGLAPSAYWLSASLATGALLKMRAVGFPDLDRLFHLGDEFIGLTDLHIVVGAAVAAEVPVNVALLLSEEAKRSARRRSTPQRVSSLATGSPATPSGVQTLLGSPEPIVLPQSPADVELSRMGGAERHWRALVGSIANVIETLKQQGVPAPAIRAITWATLRFIDGELLNALLLRRDCCSVSAAKALQTGIAALREISTFVGADCGCAPEDASIALARSTQAARYLVQGKDDCTRKALRGINILPDLVRLCPALTLQQVHRLSEHQHDDWLGGAGVAAGTQTLVLLEDLRRLMNDNRRVLEEQRGVGMNGGSRSPTKTEAGSDWVAFGTAPTPGEKAVMELDEDNLLVESSAPYKLFSSQQQFTRRLLTEAAKTFVQITTVTRAPCGPRLPNGTLPALSPAKETGRSPLPSGMSLLHAIDTACKEAGIPGALHGNEFSFLHD